MTVSTRFQKSGKFDGCKILYITSPIFSFQKYIVKENCKIAMFEDHSVSTKAIEVLKALKVETVILKTNGLNTELPIVDYVICCPVAENSFITNEKTWNVANEFYYEIDSTFDWSVLDFHNEPIKNRGCYDEALDPLLYLCPTSSINFKKCEEYITKHHWWRIKYDSWKN